MKKLMILIVLSNCIKSLNIFDSDYKGADNILTSACIERDLNKVSMLLSCGYNINKKDSRGQTAILIAAEKGYIEIVKFLLEKGANINDRNINNITMLMRASKNGHIEIVKLLIEAGANVNDKNNYKWTALMETSESNHIEVVNLLLERGANVNEKNNKGWTALMIASYHDRVKIMKLLLEAGANVNDENNNRMTVLMLASYHGSTDAVKLLTERGANVNEKDNNSDTALVHLCRKIKERNIINLEDKHMKIAYILIKRMKEMIEQLKTSSALNYNNNKSKELNKCLKESTELFDYLLSNKNISDMKLPSELFIHIIKFIN